MSVYVLLYVLTVSFPSSTLYPSFPWHEYTHTHTHTHTCTHTRTHRATQRPKKKLLDWPPSRWKKKKKKLLIKFTTIRISRLMNCPSTQKSRGRKGSVLLYSISYFSAFLLNSTSHYFILFHFKYYKSSYWF